MTKEECIELFYKIRTVYEIGEEITGYGAKCAGQEFIDFVDMRCGAMPEGEYNQLIDQGAPEQFLDFYKKIALERISFSINEIVKFNAPAKESLVKFVKENWPQQWEEELKTVMEKLQ